MNTRSYVIASALLVLTLGCHDDTTAPIEPGPASPQSSVSATVALAFWQLSAGSSHSCGVTTDQRVYCWGDNDYGSLGDGTTTQRLTPVLVRGGLAFRLVSAGGGHTCGVTTGYRAYCWGVNNFGQLGDGTTIDRVKPVPVAGGHQFRQVAAGNGYTCAVSYSDNRAYCWGRNDSGQLGNGTVSRRLTPGAVAGGRQFRQVEVNQAHTCGVTTDSRAFCWGLNNYGQLGDSTITTRLKPRPVVGSRQWRRVDVGLYHTCGVTQGDQAFCWGYGKRGQLGEGKNATRHGPVAVAGGLSFRVISAGGYHTCAITTGNRAYCWGANPWGQVGDGTSFQDRWSPRPVAGGLYFNQVSAGYDFTCGKTGAAVGYCWGWNGSGQLGNGTTEYQLSPVQVAGAM